VSAPPERALAICVGSGTGTVSALLRRPPDACCVLALAHGAGAGMRHGFLEGVAAALAGRGVASLRYQFPYAERGSRRPDARPVLVATVRAAVAATREAAPDLPLFAGGKSMGGRMTSLAQAESPLPGVCGLVFLGFPLHPAGRADAARGAHLADTALPMLFLQGTRDRLAEPALLRPLVRALGARASLHEIPEADHAFHVPKRTGRDDAAVVEELAAEIARFARRVAPGPP
jgi:predicted alpha/beta-hydrolase family hydrolase